MKKLIMIIFIFHNMISFSQANKTLRTFVANEIIEWNDAYQRNLFIHDIKLLEEFIDSDSTYCIGNYFDGKHYFEIIKYDCSLRKELYNSRKVY